MTESNDDRDQVELHEVLRGLLLLDEVFLGMQAMNADLVDAHLEELEEQLLQEYLASDRPPIPTMMFVSALSQMWVFAVYELLRTWRQRAREIIRWADTLEALAGEEREAAVAAKRQEIEERATEARDAEVRWKAFERAADPQFVEELRLAVNRTEVTFRDVEALRMTLAKHELPRQRQGMFAGAPGYGRIDMSNGSFCWQVELGGNEVTVLSRRGLADALRGMDRPNIRILPLAIQERVARMERQSYGINRVTAVFDDGTEQPGVYVAWATEVVGVTGHDCIPFEVARVVDVRLDPALEYEQDDESAF